MQMLITLLAGALLSAAPQVESARAKRGLDLIALPLVSYNTDIGLGYGAVGGAYVYSEGYRPYRHGIAAQVFFTSRGVQNHWLRYDGPNLVRSLRVEARLEWRRELLAPYYGVGNLAAPELSQPLQLADPHLYSFDRVSPGGWVRVRATPFGPRHPFSPYVGYGYRWTTVRTYDDSVLAAQQPPGLSGGSTGQLLAGLTWDTRDDEAETTQGGVEELSLRLAARPTLSQYRYAGVTLVERRYFKFGRLTVLAQRLGVDVLFGDVPFFEWSNIGGLQGSEGIGGMSSVRGVPRNRYEGNIKAFSNSELRYTPFEFSLFGQWMKAGALVFFDVGRVWHPVVNDGPWYRWHTGFGGGVRLSRRAAIVRLDVAVSPEEGTQGLYVTFGQLF